MCKRCIIDDNIGRNMAATTFTLANKDSTHSLIVIMEWRSIKITAENMKLKYDNLVKQDNSSKKKICQFGEYAWKVNILFHKLQLT